MCTRAALTTVALRLLAVALVLCLAEHALSPGLSPARHEISEYARTPSGAVMEAAFAGWALATAGCALGLWWASDGRWQGRAASAAVMLAAAGLALAAC